MKILFAVFLALAGGLVFAQPYYTAYQMRESADQRDHERLASFIDFPAVRDSLKAQGGKLAQRRVEQEIGSGPLAELGGAVGGMFSDRMIEAAVTPESLARLMEQDPRNDSGPSENGEPASSAGAQDDPDVRLGYTAWDRFVVDVDDDDKTTRMVLARQGLAWKLVAVELPE
ncbi:DUF2939 domain-containing protein [Polycyclovorans algicola]|uniref:DUF2939 domain-containing protein n=1 Tax=Polycyclovorans algicola TaxID=616992 RepID=UPI0004A76487|nr:DUF2939 domain-containing protein [Polycyclovorans algicola]